MIYAHQARAVAFAAAAAFPASATAQPDNPAATPLDEIVVRGETIETTAGPVSGFRALTADTPAGGRTPLRETPQSVSVIPRSVIDSQQVTRLAEALRNASAVKADDPRYTPGLDNPLIRGFPAETFVDGLRQFEYLPGDRESLINVERIEVVKGPSAVLFGGGTGGAAGGIINLVSKMPEPTAFGRAGLRLGSEQTFQPFFDVNRPIGETVGLRVTGEYASADSEVEVIETESYSVNPTVRLGDGGPTAVTIQGRLSRWEGQQYQGLPATGTVAGDFRIERDLFIGPDDIEPSDSDAVSATAIATHRFDEVWSARAAARWSDNSVRQKAQILLGADGFVGDTPLIPPSTWGLVNAELYQRRREANATASVAAEFQTGPARHRVTFGADYGVVDGAGFLDLRPVSGAVDLSAPAFPFPYAAPGEGNDDLFLDTRSAGAFAQLQSTVSDRLHLLGALRLGSVELDYRNDAICAAAETDETTLLPRVGAVVDLTPTLSVFAGYGEGLRGQPFLDFATPPEPEESRQIEVGLRVDFGLGFSGSAALFQIDRSNAPVTDPATFAARAIGEQRSRGLDVDLVWALGGGFQLLASYAYVEAEFTEDASVAGGVIPAGSRLPGVPEQSGRLWIEHVFQGEALRGLSLGAGLYAQTGEAIGVDDGFESEGYYTVDAALRYEGERFDVALSARNLTDQDYFDRYGYLGGRVAPSEGLAAFFTLAARF